jgi:hypothetical protein
MGVISSLSLTLKGDWKMANKMNMQQIVLLGEVLKECCMTVDGSAVYKSGWDDAKVLETVIERNQTDRPYVANQVANMRLDLFGSLRKSTGSTGGDTMRRIDELEKLVQSLMAWKEEVMKRFGPVTGSGRPGRPQSTPPTCG